MVFLAVRGRGTEDNPFESVEEGQGQGVIARCICGLSEWMVSLRLDWHLLLLRLR